jgi:asparagine synthase (glutamine-hydrolysing)
VAREAFAAQLPVSILHRRSKGRPDSFSAEIFEQNVDTLREMLLGGLLAANGLLDRAAIAAILKVEAPLRGLGFDRILQLADTEAWARSWDARSATPQSVA